MTTRGFTGSNRSRQAAGLPPGQYVTDDFPVMSAGPTPRTALEHWSFALRLGDDNIAEWRWNEFTALPQTKMSVNIHCVTKWSKLNTRWRGVSIDTLFEAAGIDPPAGFVMAHCDGDYTTNVPMEDLLGGKAMIALEFEGAPLSPEHGGPARLFVPHLYLWKSAKWVRSLCLMDADAPGFWEAAGYHMYGDPHREQRYSGD